MHLQRENGIHLQEESLLSPGRQEEAAPPRLSSSKGRKNVG